jgi:hypothetical protein
MASPALAARLDLPPKFMAPAAQVPLEPRAAFLGPPLVPASTLGHPQAQLPANDGSVPILPPPGCPGWGTTGAPPPPGMGLPFGGPPRPTGPFPAMLPPGVMGGLPPPPGSEPLFGFPPSGWVHPQMPPHAPPCVQPPAAAVPLVTPHPTGPGGPAARFPPGFPAGGPAPAAAPLAVQQALPVQQADAVGCAPHGLPLYVPPPLRSKHSATTAAVPAPPAPAARGPPPGFPPRNALPDTTGSVPGADAAQQIGGMVGLMAARRRSSTRS